MYPHSFNELYHRKGADIVTDYSEKVKYIVYQQMEMLAEESRKTDSIETKLKIAAEIDRIAGTLLND